MHVYLALFLGIQINLVSNMLDSDQFRPKLFFPEVTAFQSEEKYLIKTQPPSVVIVIHIHSKKPYKNVI